MRRNEITERNMACMEHEIHNTCAWDVNREQIIKSNSWKIKSETTTCVMYVTIIIIMRNGHQTNDDLLVSTERDGF